MSIPIYLDSWWEPSPAAIAWAKAQGFAGWFGYFKQTDTDRIYHGWADQTFLAIKAAGLVTGDYCSGFDDPLWVRDRNSRLGMIGFLDAENSIRPDGPWVDPWLDAAGTCLYGTGDTIANHSTHAHPGYVLAGYPSNSGTPNPIDPGLTWGTVALPNPTRPIARQYAGGVPTPFGPVDYSHFGPGFFGATPQKGDDLPLFLFYERDNAAGGVNAAFIGDGISARWLRSAQEVADVDAIFKPTHWNLATTPVADFRAFGAPIDADTAVQQGIPWPAPAPAPAAPHSHTTPTISIPAGTTGTSA